jgi:hypothetical protein
MNGKYCRIKDVGPALLLHYSGMKKEEAIQELVLQMGIATEKEFPGKEELARIVNGWIEHDFEKLVRVLYRMDVSEVKLRSLLKENPGTDAGLLITELMIERQLQKIKSRDELKSKNDDIPEDEKW